MAGTSMKDIKLRIKSMESTKQITKAMQMVASSKLRHAQDRITKSRPYLNILSDTMDGVIRDNKDFSSVFLNHRPVKKLCYIVIAGDRGLAGGYNSNILKMIYADIQSEDAEVQVVPIGKKAAEFFHARKVEIYSEAYSVAAEVSISDCFTLAKQLCKAFAQDEFDEVRLGWTNFVSILSQSPASRKVLPMVRNAEKDTGVVRRNEILYEPSAEEVYDAIVPEYLGGLIYGCLCESIASELAARRTAMDSATKNADEMIASLSLEYNRARQSAITQELTEIVAGAEA